MIDGSDDYEPGCIYQIGKNDMYVQTGKGALSLVEVQLQGKKLSLIHIYSAFTDQCTYQI